MGGFFRRNYFLIILTCMFLLTDIAVYKLDPVNNLPLFNRNDFNKTRMVHPESDWEKIFFGNSTVAASYLEDESKSGYINVGINYGKLTDLEGMLTGKHIAGTKEIVVGLNFFTLMDNLPTDPSYIWHKKSYEPYLYFYRSQFKKVLTNGLTNLTQSKPFIGMLYTSSEKELYHGRLDDEKIKAKAEEYVKKYGDLTLADFNGNIKALKNVIEYCDKNGIRLRAVWMPWNPVNTPPAYVEDLKNIVDGIMAENDVEYLNWISGFGTEYFHDLGHLNYEAGAPKFSGEIEEWLVN